MLSADSNLQQDHSRTSKWCGVSLRAVLGLTAVLFFFDLIVPGVNIGILYLVPLALAIGSRLGNRSFILLVMLMILLTCFDHLWEGHVYPGVPADSTSLFNWGFIMAAIAMCSGIMILVRHLRFAYYDVRSREGNAPRGSKKTLLGWTAALLTMAIFAFDIATPNNFNVPILYLIPLALIILVNTQIVHWRIVVLMLGLSALGYCFSVNGSIGPQQSLVIITNRLLAGVGLVLVFLLLHLFTRMLSGQMTNRFTHAG